ncbi:uncharacterized protein [Haliotis asinina]|uniref:uncharacterized protein isoform X2 n=1 Tax=Haliotis asinina TaxID=109174 RepID=UPI00353258E2
MLMESASSMFDVQNIYGTPQIPRKRPCLRPRRMTLIDLRNVPLTEEDAPQRKSSAGTIRSEGGASQYYAKGGGILPVYDSSSSLESRCSSSSSSMKIRHHSSGVFDGSTRFPKLEECAHFHYESVELGPLEVQLCEEDRENYHHNEEENGEYSYLLRVKSNDKTWNVRRTYGNFRMLDRQLHKCIFDRKFSHLPELQKEVDSSKNNKELERVLRRYLKHFSEIAGSMINCGSVLNWLEIDNRGNRLLAVDDSGINTPAIAAAHVVKRYNAQAVDEISLDVGDIVSVIDMPPADDTIWWRGKRGFEVGFFPSECVEVIGDKVPPSMASRIPPPPASKKPLMKKHGKLMSFLRTFFSTRPARNQLKQSGIVKERVFGCDLGEHLLNSGNDGELIPLVLKSCTEVIEKHGIVDGIYRLSGITSNIQKLRLAFDEDRVPDLTADCYLQDIHSISSLLKMYFRELPNPLLTYQLYDKFADAVRDEDNKLLKIHDVVQQLPPPHYRTTEYLMRHLARVAGFGPDTGMHSKNLAIVWAPNLLRSKELEMGGGAAALQGVGIQAVVTECLICYCDIIFSDKMPSYSSPELQKSHKKPRPKSLAISTPTRLLTLEEARERAFLGGLNPNQRYIDVGGGPDSLPSKYHTVIDLPGYRKKANTVKETSSKGNKKSPVSGWKSFFSKPRAGSIKKARKSSIQGSHKELDTVSLGGVGSRQAKALTEEDVHNWKKRLRTAKSAESLLSLASSSRSSSSRCSKVNDNLMVVNVYGEKHPHTSHHKRSLSSDATAILHHHSYDNPFTNSGREVPIDVDLSVTPHEQGIDPHQTGRRSRSEKRGEPERKQSFIRGDSTRKALHRRTPSAPNTPRNDRSSSESRKVASRHKTSSQPSLESPHLELGRDMDSSGSCDEDEQTDRWLGSLLGNSPQIQRNVVCQNGDGKPPRSSEEISPQKRCAKMPPIGRKKQKANVEKNISLGSSEEDILTVQLPESPGARRKGQNESEKSGDKNKNEPIITQYFYSRHHDYAEILSDEDSQQNGSPKVRETMIMGSPSSMSELIDQLDNKLTSTGMQYGIYETIPSPPEKTIQKADGEKVLEEKHAPPMEVKTEHLPNRPVEFREIGPHEYKEIKTPESNKSLNSEIKTLESNLQQMHHSQPQPQMSKCLSVPSDIAKSLENVNVGSQSDLLSSVTISELSQSVDSFNLSLCDDSPMGEARRRRSASLDSLTDSPLSRTLKEINMQIDNAFKRNVDRALEMEEEGYGRHESPVDDLPPLHISEDVLTPTNPQETDFPSEIPDYARIDKSKTRHKAEKQESSGLPKMRFSPVDQIEIVSGNVKTAPPSAQQPHQDRTVRDSVMNGQTGAVSFSERNNNSKQTSIAKPTDLKIVAAPRVMKAPSKSSGESSSGSGSHVADICAQEDSSSSSTTSSDSESSTETESEDNSECSIEYVCHNNSQPTNFATGFPQSFSESHISDSAMVKSSLRNSNASLPGYSSSGGRDSDMVDQESLTWRDSPIFSDSGSQDTPTGTLRSQTPRGNITSPQSMGRSSPRIPYTASSSSVESSPRLSPRTSPNVVQNLDHRSVQDSRFGGDRLVLPGDFYCTGGQPGGPAYSPTSRHRDPQYPSVSYRGNVSPSNFHMSPSLPEVHVVHDTLTVEKSTIKRSTTESKLADKTSQQVSEAYSSKTFPRKDPEKRFHQRLPYRHDHDRSSEMMDVDHVCNMSDSVQSDRTSPCSVSYSIDSGNLQQHSQFGDDGTVSPDTSVTFTLSPQSSSYHSEVMEVETSLVLSSESNSQNYVHSSYKKSQSRGTEIVKVESFDEVRSKVVKNVLHSGTEMTGKEPVSHQSQIPVKRERKSVPVPKKRQQKHAPPTECDDMPSLCGGSFMEPPIVKIRSPSPRQMPDLAPPSQEVMEVKRPTVKRSERQETPPLSFGQDNISRTVIVKEITSEKGDAKLVIERRPNLKKNIQTVRAKKVPHPPRQLAEAVDDLSDSVTPDLSSTGPSDADPSGISSQEDDVFSDVDSHRQRLPLHPRFTPDPDVLMIEEGNMVEYSHSLHVKTSKPVMATRHVEDMIGSRSSLDESVLQLAAERHDTFGPEDLDSEESGTYHTGSLRVKRSQKMQSLMDLFEKGSDQNLADSSSPNEDCQPSPQLSMSLPSSALRSLDGDMDTDDEASAPSPRLVHTSLSRRSRSRERMRRSGMGSDKENRITSRSPTPTRPKVLLDRAVEERHPPSSPAEVGREYRARRKEKYSNFSKPPRYRSGSHGRTQSESSTSESEGSHYMEGSFHSRSSDYNASSGSDTVLRDKNRAHDWSDPRSQSIRHKSDENPHEKSGSGLQRRGSIKELMDYFERQKNQEEQAQGQVQHKDERSPPVKPRSTRGRVRSVSPCQGAVSRPTMDASTPPSYRFSLELPSSAAVTINEGGGVKNQPLRLGPKPFYGVKK